MTYFLYHAKFILIWINKLKVYALQKWREKAWQQKKIIIHIIAKAKYNNLKWKYNKKA
jgi:hypothetical protein